MANELCANKTADGDVCGGIILGISLKAYGGKGWCPRCNAERVKVFKANVRASKKSTLLKELVDILEEQGVL